MRAEADLIEALVGAYRRFVHSRLAERRLAEPTRFEAALDEGEAWLSAALERLLGLPFDRQPRGPLEVFQEALRYPTAVLRAAGVEPVERDPVAENALPGDLYGLAPASSRDLGEEVWRRHLAWGAAKARAMSGRSRSGVEGGLTSTPMTTRHAVEVGRARIPVIERGRGPLAVLIHGFPLDHRSWLDQLEGLGSDERRVAAVDMRGHGGSPWAGDAVHHMEMLADDIAAVIQELSPDGRADVAGLSMGGYVVLALVERHPELVRSMALVSSRAVADGPEAREARDAMAASTVSEGRGWLAEKLLPNLVAPGAPLVVKARVRSMIESQPVETIVADLAGIRDRADRSEVLEAIAVPVAVIHGVEDSLIRPAESEAMAASVAGARLALAPGSGHMAPLERPDVVDQALRDLWRAAAS